MKAMKILSVLVLSVGVLGGARAEEPETFRALLMHYEQMRLALVADQMTDIKDNASAIAERAGELFGAFDERAAGVPEAEADTAKTILGGIEAAAAKVAAAPDLAAVREVFFDLSKPMGRYRKLTGDTSTIVVFCPMVKKAWLQPDGEVGNPYLGQEMPTCGNHIPD